MKIPVSVWIDYFEELPVKRAKLDFIRTMCAHMLSDAFISRAE